ncbi:hypothetical protein HK103_003672 [Boothiomyces macroporosus]|uniref:Uncharacterized protein n=1 Tax=Boothiomyces macroporosus TaxID=261099 RepID=A0AAD5UID5_9FUNG|nr:hypothetical protein HK103_003672 [Boothiomyces macroporosus]
MFKYLAITASALALVPAGLSADFALPDNEVLFNKYFGKGTQNYKCNGTVWALDSADAELYLANDYTGSADITHFFLPTPDAKGGRPSWKYHADGSVVTGIVTKKVNAPSSADIQWLYINKTSSTSGVLENVDYVFRLYTKSGIAPPASECAAAKAGNITKLPYEAQYWFYKASPAATTTIPVATTSSAANLQPVMTTAGSYYSDAAAPKATTSNGINYGDAPMTTTTGSYHVVSSASKVAGSFIGLVLLFIAQ